MDVWGRNNMLKENKSSWEINCDEKQINKNKDTVRNVGKLHAIITIFRAKLLKTPQSTVHFPSIIYI